MKPLWIETKTILTKTSGFLAQGYTHTLNAFEGCAHAGSLCGLFCYAMHNRFITHGRRWAFYGAKANTRELYRNDYDRLKRSRGGPKPLRIYMSSVTDPYIPQEKTLYITQGLLEEMIERPPDVLVIQTHAVLVSRDLEAIVALSRKTNVLLCITIETDMERVLGLPPHPSSPTKRRETLKLFRDRGVLTQATISPILPIANAEKFAADLNEASTRVVIDHYEIGDGSPGGFRTKRTAFPRLLEKAGFGQWNSVGPMQQVQAVLERVLGKERVLLSRAGFNEVSTIFGVEPIGQPMSMSEAAREVGLD